MNEPNESCWIAVITTNKYAGNFEREICAYCTGVIGDCGVGEKIAEAFPYNKDKWEDKMLQSPDEHGCYRPVSIWGAPKYNDVAMFFYKRPSKSELNIIRLRAKEFAANNKLEILSFGLLQYVVTRTMVNVDWE